MHQYHLHADSQSLLSPSTSTRPLRRAAHGRGGGPSRSARPPGAGSRGGDPAAAGGGARVDDARCSDDIDDQHASPAPCHGADDDREPASASRGVRRRAWAAAAREGAHLAGVQRDGVGAPLLARDPPLARWPGAITVFAAPDAFLQASCPMCSRRHLLQQHIAMGYYPYSDLAAAATMKIPSASVGFCIKVVTERGPFGIHYARIYADGVEVSHPELYNDSRYVVHGLHGFLRPLTHSCFDGPHHHHLTGTAPPRHPRPPPPPWCAS
ncbi:hypothetical protein ZWY2020_030007 [Hordeum vulgare]|nr:hypothetical protein ZWY2020_030007 [Hordeum vulgare]